jgi:hypothetical protein
VTRFFESSEAGAPRRKRIPSEEVVPEMPPASCNRSCDFGGASHEKIQDKGKAIADYRTAPSIDPSSRGAALARDNLKRLGAGP